MFIEQTNKKFYAITKLSSNYWSLRHVTRARLSLRATGLHNFFAF